MRGFWWLRGGSREMGKGMEKKQVYQVTDEQKAALERGERRAEEWRRERQLVLYATAILQGHLASGLGGKISRGAAIQDIWDYAEEMYEEEKRRLASGARPDSTTDA